MNKLLCSLVRNHAVTAFAVLSMLSTQALAYDFDLLKSAPVGSWQVREQIDTNHKGKKTGSTIKTSMVGKEQRNGKPHYWIEMHIDSFEIKKSGKRKSTGKPAIVKSLVPADVLNDDPENAINNLRAFGVETIVQNGDQQPMRISDSGGFVAGAMKMANVEIQHDYTKLGKETVNVSAGEFSTDKISGSGNVSMKIVFKKINVDSDSVVWLSNKVPFGVVKMQGTTVTNGKTSTQQGELLEFSKSGAQSAITGEPQDMPSLNPFAQ